MTSVPDGLNPQIQTREIVFDAEVDLVTPFLKLATVSRGGSGHMTFASDVMQALQHPVPVTGRTMLNGAPLEASGATG